MVAVDPKHGYVVKHYCCIMKKKCIYGSLKLCIKQKYNLAVRHRCGIRREITYPQVCEGYKESQEFKSIWLSFLVLFVCICVTIK